MIDSERDLTFNFYSSIADLTAVYPEISAIMDGNPRVTVDLSIMYPALKLAGEAGEVAEQIGKMIRDDSGVMSEERREKIIRELGDVLWYVNAIANEIGETMEHIARVNIAKLAKRRDEGTLKGSGSDR